MIADGLFERFPRPELCPRPAREASTPRRPRRPGARLRPANVDSVDITIAARAATARSRTPPSTRSPGRALVTNLQTIVSRAGLADRAGGGHRRLDPRRHQTQHHPRRGRAAAHRALLQPEVRRYLLDAIRRTAEQTARAAGFPDELLPVVSHKEEEFTPSTYNDPELVERLAGVFSGVLGEAAVARMSPVMGGEDFSRYGLEGEIPIAIFWLGAVDPEKVRRSEETGATLPSLHSSEFAPARAGDPHRRAGDDLRGAGADGQVARRALKVLEMPSRSLRPPAPRLQSRPAPQRGSSANPPAFATRVLRFPGFEIVSAPARRSF